LRGVSKNLGLRIGEDEMMDLQFGAEQSPIMRQNWAQNPQMLSTYKKQLEDGKMSGDLAAFWSQQSKQIGKAKIQEKLSNIVSKAIYTPNWMAEASFADDNTKVDFQYVKIPFDAINNEVELTDADYQNHINKYPARFNEKVETRNIEYTVFDVIPSAQDSADLRIKMDTLLSEFSTTPSDSLFALRNTGFYSPVYLKSETMPDAMKEAIKTVGDGEIYGPYIDQGSYTLFKRIASVNVADTVKAQQILINADINNEIQLANANKQIDSLRRLFKRGISFDSLAIKNSQDNSSAFNGGDMGIVTQQGLYQRNPALTSAIFYQGKKKGVFKVQTSQGVHLVKINELTYSDEEPEYKVAMVGLPIIPSKNTQNVVSDQVSDFILSHNGSGKDINTLKAALSEAGRSFQVSAPVKENDFTLDALGAGDTSRDIIRWAFDEVREVGDISKDIHTYSDPINYNDSKYVIATLKSINSKGMQSVESLRSTLEPVVMNRKKAEAFASGLTVSSLADLAAQYGSEVETATNASIGSPFIPGIGNEPEVVGVAYKTDNQAISQPIIGETGVYILKPISKSEAGDIVNLPSIKKNVSTSMKSQVGFSLLESLKSAANIEDNRSSFY